MFEQILSYFTFDLTEIIALSLFFVFFLVQIYFYLAYYRKPYSFVKNREREGYSPMSSSKPKVSVVLVSENEANILSLNLPAILKQDYPNFEVIVVNNGSTDESYELLQSLKLYNPHLYHTHLPYSNDKVFWRRKLALTIGIKAAKGDILLFTEPYSRPVSDQWISSMINEMGDSKDIVLGYSYYRKNDNYFNRVARFDNHIFSMQYLAMAIDGEPYIGTYRNIAFRKHLFFENKGFASYLNMENGEDVFINRIVSSNNTSIALSQDSFVETSADKFSVWTQIKRSYSAAKSYFQGKAVTLFAFEAFSRCAFYLLLIALIIYSILYLHWALLGIALFIFIIRFIMQLSIINKSAEYFRSGKFHFSLILMDILQPIYNLRFRTKPKNVVR